MAVQEKHGKDDAHTDDDNVTDSSSEDEEDDDGVLASGELDAQVQSTLAAIQRKDPQVYDSSTIFYTDDVDAEASNDPSKRFKEEKPMFLTDYHRRNLLKGPAETELNGSTFTEPSYAQHQEFLKTSIVREMHATATEADVQEGNESEENEDGDGFLVRRSVQRSLEHNSGNDVRKLDPVDIESAEKDPDAYLADFMSSRAWILNGASNLEVFESDDEEEERRADAFEEAYNLRFEHHDKSNEKLVSHARDTAAKYSVRKDALNPRRKAREAESAKKQAEKQTRAEEKARLRKLKVLEAEDRVRQIREAAGLKKNSIPDENWSKILRGSWDDTRWNESMKDRFNDEYYDEQDFDAEKPKNSGLKREKTKKPKWKTGIDIDDLVPDFDADAKKGTEEFHLTDDEETTSAKVTDLVNEKESGNGHGGQQLRLERRDVEKLVDEELDVEEKLANFGKKHSGHFKYRETSPISWGLTTSDILMADDTQLNQFAGLKKLAAFRDPDKKRKDKRHLGKKARLRQWRVDTFGSEQSPKYTSEHHQKTNAADGTGVDAKAKSRSKKILQKRKAPVR